VAKLRAEGATRIIALASMTKKDARRAGPGGRGHRLMVLIAAGDRPPSPRTSTPPPIVVGSTIVVAPANRGQVVSRLDLTLRPGGGP
jgi:2',3'-cyclic-nucleotide 2'-phosphodiesterase (5'-nucleotidase family)